MGLLAKPEMIGYFRYRHPAVLEQLTGYGYFDLTNVFNRGLSKSFFEQFGYMIWRTLNVIGEIGQAERFAMVVNNVGLQPIHQILLDRGHALFPGMFLNDPPEQLRQDSFANQLVAGRLVEPLH